MASITNSRARFLALPLAVSIAILAGCNNASNSSNTPQPQPQSQSQSQLEQQADAPSSSYIETYSYAGQLTVETGQVQMTAIANAEMDRTAKGISSHQDNYVFSPYEETNTLGMLALGAVTDQAAQDAISIWNQQLQQLIAPTIWQRSTSLWGHENYLFLDSYLDAMSRHYDPQMSALSFKTDMAGSTQAISDWLGAASNSKLLPLMTFTGGNQIDERTRVVTLNVESLTGEWPALFDATQTTDERFKMLDGTMKLIPTMHTTGTFNVHETDQYLAFDLPLKNSSLAMLVIMPKKGEFENVQKQLASESLLEKITASLQPVETTLHLPRFSVETVEELATPADDSIDYGSFSNVNGQGYLQLKQKARMAIIDIAESGVIAKAGGMTILEATPDEPDSVWSSFASSMSAIWVGQTFTNANTPCYYPPLTHPFIFVLRETTTAATLYAGVWTTPPGPAMEPDWTVSWFNLMIDEAEICGTSPSSPSSNTDLSSIPWDTGVWGTPTTTPIPNPF